MQNVARKVRETLGLTQVEFARRIGKSYASVQNYDRGVPPSPGAQQAIVKLASECGLGDLVDDWIAAREGKAAEEAEREDQVWIGRLVRILHGGDRGAVEAVKGMLKALDAPGRKGKR